MNPLNPFDLNLLDVSISKLISLEAGLNQINTRSVPFFSSSPILKADVATRLKLDYQLIDFYFLSLKKLVFEDF